MGNDIYLRMRMYTYFDMIGFAPYFADNRYNGTIEELLRNYYSLNSKLVADEIAAKISVIEAVAIDFFKLPLEQLRSKRKYEDLVRARQMVCGIACRIASEKKVAEVIGRTRDFVHFNKARCDFYMSNERQYKSEFDQLEKLCVVEINKRLNKEDAEKS